MDPVILEKDLGEHVNKIFSFSCTRWLKQRLGRLSQWVGIELGISDFRATHTLLT